jgi:hypothetical protein
MTRRLRLVIAALAALSAVWAPGTARAQATGTTLQVSGPIEASVGDTVELMATLKDAAGAPVAGVQLLVEERLGFFDTKAGDVTVASAATAGDGVAAIRYVARREGARSLIVRFPGNSEFAATSAGLEFAVASGPATYTVEAPPGIPGVNRFVLILVLAGVWGTMLVVAGHVAAIARSGGQASLEDREAAG